MKALYLPKKSQQTLIRNSIQKKRILFILEVPIYLLGSIAQKNQDRYLKVIKNLYPFKVNDEIFLVEDMSCDCNIGLNNSTGRCLNCNKFIDPSFVQKEMRAEQSRLKLIVEEFSLLKVQDLTSIQRKLLIGNNDDNINEFKEWFNAQYKNYEENPYIFLTECFYY